MKGLLNRLRERYQVIPEKKRWFDVITAALTIPVLLTVIISNILSIQSKRGDGNQVAASTPTNSQQPINIHVDAPASSTSASSQPSTSPMCQEGVPDIAIVFPQESQTVGGDPVCIVHTGGSGNFCSLNWSYRVNNRDWTDTSNQPVCLYNMADGQVVFELRVTGENGETKTVRRAFIYQNNASPPASESAQL